MKCLDLSKNSVEVISPQSMRLRGLQINKDLLLKHSVNKIHIVPKTEKKV